MVLLIIIPMKNGYFIGKINPIFRQTQVQWALDDPGSVEIWVYRIMEDWKTRIDVDENAEN